MALSVHAPKKPEYAPKRPPEGIRQAKAQQTIFLLPAAAAAAFSFQWRLGKTSAPVRGANTAGVGQLLSPYAGDNKRNGCDLCAGAGMKSSVVRIGGTVRVSQGEDEEWKRRPTNGVAATE